MKIFYYDDYDGRTAAALYSYPLWCLSKVSGTDDLSSEEKVQVDEYVTRSIFVKSNYSSKPIDPDTVENGETVIILGLSINKKRIQVLDNICKKARDVLLIDSHKGSFDLVQSGLAASIKNLKCIVNEDACTCELVWKYMFSDGSLLLPDFIELIKDYTKWSLKDSRSLDFVCGLNCNNGDLVWSDIYTRLITDALIKSDNYEKIRKFPVTSRFENTLIGVICDGRTGRAYMSNRSSCYYSEFGFEDNEVFGVRTMCVNWKSSSAVFGSDFHTAPLCCTFAFNGDVWSYTLYSSNQDIDCAELAKKYGGDGRKGVAGFSLPYCLFGNRDSTIEKS